jgi:hypothetical protein
MTIDLLSRLTTDATLRAKRAADRKIERNKPEWHPFAAGNGSTSPPQARGEGLPPNSGSPRVLSPFASSPPDAGEARGGVASPQASPASPRALVLRIVETFCTACGARYRAPSVVLAEYDDNSRSVNRHADDIRRLERQATAEHQRPVNGHPIPRHHEVVTVHAPACEKCF